MPLMNLDASAFLADPQLIQALKGRSRSVDCSQERILFCQGDHPAGVYILHAGECIVSMRDEEGEHAFNLRLGPGSLLGLPGAISNIAYSLSATALAGAEVSFVPREEFSNLMLTEPGLALLILKVLAAEVRTARIAACKG
jgi:CRP/FNR family transcriptional regulator, cyclic AMP receptor protein